MCSCIINTLLVLLSIIFPPLPVWIKRGICSSDSFINILLTILGYVPGLIHSWYIIASYPRPHTNIYYIYGDDLEHQGHHHHHHDAPVRNQPAGTHEPHTHGYGSTN